MTAYPADYPKAERGSPLDKVYRALWRYGSHWSDGQDWQCPHHDDNRASLGVRAGDEHPVLLFCQAGCKPSEILATLGLAWSDVMFDPKDASGKRLNPANPRTNTKPRQRRIGGGSQSSDASVRGARTARQPSVKPQHVHGDECVLVDERRWYYTDENDVRLSGVKRWDYDHEPHKTITQMSVDGVKPKDARYVLYRLADVIAQVKAGGRIVLVEGEPSVDVIVNAGWERAKTASRKRSMVATTMRAGAGKEIAWRDEYTAALKNASEVVIVADRDLAGYRHAKLVADKLAGAGVTVKVVQSRTTRRKDDVVEHIADGGTFADLVRVSSSQLDSLITKLEAREPEAATPGLDRSDKFTLSDDENVWPNPGDPRGVAMHFIDMQFRDADERLLLKFWRDDFYVWTGTHWRVIIVKELQSMLEEKLHDAVFRVPLEEDGIVTGYEEKKFPLTHARVKDITHFLESLCLIALPGEPPVWLDGSHTDGGLLIAMKNGLLNVDARTLENHTPSYFNLTSLPFGYRKSARCAEWQSFLQSVWIDDPKSIRLLQEIMGLLVSGETKYQKIAMLVGPPRSGKGTIGDTISAIIGREGIAAPQLKQIGSHFGLQPLLGKSVALIGDARFSGQSSEIVAQLLSISGGDTATVDRKGRESWTGKLPVRFVVMSNEPPALKDQSAAFASRMLMLRMTETFLGREDLGLFDRIERELPGIFNWALDGLDRLRKREADDVGTGALFTRPARSIAAEREMVRLTSPISAFVEDMCTIDPQQRTRTSAMWSAWQSYAKDRGEFIGSQEAFGRSLLSAFPHVQARQLRLKLSRVGNSEAVDNRARVYIGVKLHDPDGIYE